MTSIGIYAKENVDGSLIISGENIEQYLQKYKFLLEHGIDLELESDSITMEGSAPPSASKDDASPSRPLSPPGGLMELTDASLQRGRQG
jgi:hypothetical protein